MLSLCKVELDRVWHYAEDGRSLCNFVYSPGVHSLIFVMVAAALFASCLSLLSTYPITSFDIDVQHFYYECGHKLHTQIDINIEVVQI